MAVPAADVTPLPLPWSRLVAGSLLVILVTAASVLLVLDAFALPTTRKETAAFQTLVGGLGGGPAVDLSRCAFSFDPRLCPHCPLQDGPIPGGVSFCPQHACSVLYLPPWSPNAERETRDGSQ